MLPVKCPQCGQGLKVEQALSADQGLRCPKCKHAFRYPVQAAPAPEGGYTEGGMGWTAKGAIGLVAFFGVGFLVVLLYVAIKGPSDRMQSEITGGSVQTQPTAPSAAQLNPQVTPVKDKFGVVLTAQELFKRASPAVVRVVVRDKKFAVIGQGSGFFVSADGLLVTNYHVIEKADFASVLLAGNATLFVEGVAAVDPNADLAILKVNGTGVDFLRLATGDPPPVGAKVYAIGNPQGLTNTLSEGLVSAHRDANGVLAMIQTTAPISPGSSGGPLFAENGQVVGVTESYLAKGQNLNFAVPAEKVRGLLAKRGKLQTLASAGGLRLEREATEKLDQAWAAMRRKDWSGAAAILTELCKTERENRSVWYGLGCVHYELGKYEIAIGHFQQVIALDSIRSIRNIPTHRFLARAYENLGRYAEAIVAYKQVIAIDPNDDCSYFDLGQAYRKSKLYAEAIVAYKQAIALDPNCDYYYHDLAISYTCLDRDAEAIAAYKQAIVLKPNETYYYSSLSQIYQRMKRYDEAIAAYKQAIVLKPNDAYYYSSLSQIYQMTKRYDEAIAAYKQVIALDPNRAYHYCSLARIYEESERYAEAIAAYKQAIVLKPDFADYHFFLGKAYEKANNYDEAIAAFKKVIAIQPDSAEAYYDTGNASGRLGRNAEAIAAYKKAIAIDPDYTKAYYNMGVAYAKLARHAEEIGAYQKVITTKQYCAEAFFIRGNAYGKLGRNAEAIAAYEECLFLEPTGALADSAREAIVRLRKR